MPSMKQLLIACLILCGCRVAGRRFMTLQKLLAAAAIAAALVCVQAQESVRLTAPPPAGAQSVSTSLTGNPGNATYCYFVIATFPRGNSTPGGPGCIFNAPSTLTAGNFV